MMGEFFLREEGAGVHSGARFRYSAPTCWEQEEEEAAGMERQMASWRVMMTTRRPRMRTELYSLMVDRTEFLLESRDPSNSAVCHSFSLPASNSDLARRPSRSCISRTFPPNSADGLRTCIVGIITDLDICHLRKVGQIVGRSKLRLGLSEARRGVVVVSGRGRRQTAFHRQIRGRWFAGPRRSSGLTTIRGGRVGTNSVSAVMVPGGTIQKLSSFDSRPHLEFFDLTQPPKLQCSTQKDRLN